MLVFIGDIRRHAGIHRARANAVHRDPARRQFHGQRSREPDDAGFARGIGADAFGRAERFGGRDIHHPASATFRQMRQAFPN